jgi:hypothetical protein
MRLSYIYSIDNCSLIKGVTDLEILIVLVTRLLRQDLNRLVEEIKLVELWDKG